MRNLPLLIGIAILILYGVAQGEKTTDYTEITNPTDAAQWYLYDGGQPSGQRNRKVTIGTLKTILTGNTIDLCAPPYNAVPDDSTDLAPIIASAISSVSSRGGFVDLLLSKPGVYKIASTITIGDATGSTWSTYQGIRLRGAGAGSTRKWGAVGAVATTIKSYVAGPAILINGPLSGWGIEDINITFGTTDSAAIGLKVVSGQDGYVRNLAINSPPGIGILETTRTNYAGSGVWNTSYNVFENVSLYMPPTVYPSAIGLKITGGDANSNTCFDTFRGLMINKGVTSGPTGIYLGWSDNVHFYNTAIMGTSYPFVADGVVYDFTDVGGKGPQENKFFGLDPGGNTIIAIGTFSQLDRMANRIFSMSTNNRHDGELPSFDGLTIVNEGSGSGSVTSVSSANSGISVADGTTTPTLTLGTGGTVTGAIQGRAADGGLTADDYVKLDTSNHRIYNKGFVQMQPYTAPTAATAALNATAGNLSGSYTYAITFVTANSGETELGTASNTVSGVSSQQIDLSAIPTGPTGTTARKIYRTKGTGSNKYYLATLADNTTTTYTDNIADTSLTNFASNRSNSTAGLMAGTTKAFVASAYGTYVGLAAGHLGTTAGNSDNTGGYNTVMGTYAANVLTTAGDATLIGHGAGLNLTAGASNTCVGSGCLGSVVTGNYNTCTGANCLSATTGNENTALGLSAGRAITTGAQNTFIGKDAGYTGTTNSVSKSIAIGYNAQVTASNVAQIGGSGADAVDVYAKSFNSTAITASQFTEGYSAPAAGSSFSPALGTAALYAYTQNANTTITLPKSAPAGASTLNFKLIQGSSAYTTTWTTVDAAGTVTWATGAWATITASKKQYITCITGNTAATTTAAWDCFKSGLEF